MIIIAFHNLQYVTMIKTMSFNKFILKYKRLIFTKNFFMINLVYHSLMITWINFLNNDWSKKNFLDKFRMIHIIHMPIRICILNFKNTHLKNRIVAVEIAVIEISSLKSYYTIIRLKCLKKYLIPNII